jgi:hypothetical protein
MASLTPERLAHDLAVPPLENGDFLTVVAVEQPVERVVHRAANGVLVALEDAFLPEVEQAEDDDHAQLVGAVKDAFQPLALRVSFRTK